MPRLLPIAQLTTLILAPPAAPTSGQNIVADVPLTGGGSERVLFAGPTNPPAILVMLAGGDGIIEISNSGAITGLGGNFLLRTRSLWLGKGFAVAILGPPNGASLLGQRHTPAYADAISRAADFARTRANARYGSSAPVRARRRPPTGPPISARKWQVGAELVGDTAKQFGRDRV
jgi:hypothetical protein